MKSVILRKLVCDPQRERNLSTVKCTTPIAQRAARLNLTGQPYLLSISEPSRPDRRRRTQPHPMVELAQTSAYPFVLIEVIAMQPAQNQNDCAQQNGNKKAIHRSSPQRS